MHLPQDSSGLSNWGKIGNLSQLSSGLPELRSRLRELTFAVASSDGKRRLEGLSVVWCVWGERKLTTEITCQSHNDCQIKPLASYLGAKGMQGIRRGGFETSGNNAMRKPNDHVSSVNSVFQWKEGRKILVMRTLASEFQIFQVEMLVDSIQPDTFKLRMFPNYIFSSMSDFHVFFTNNLLTRVGYTL
ncbi:uncharacterized protein BDR25DRAFT_361746 [Lindgomyces ingoldianus]|uniref:Uncharacterized protein n=1 Tax=Lindgomyces ingoldianus TaxID=673940 RepID=A0ACB6QBE9_9PLEO|nr:uncharacterized protein BDR25DRAFT_361746 [Lindgomyces ingoldianus]KAF2464237.1 hypothetical protein BDR25DRAFT_361746 [Lindgomyces ingoldianus]